MKIVIEAINANQRIDKYLKKLLINAPSSFIYKMFRKKDVKVNGVKVNQSYILKENDVIDLFLYEDRFLELSRKDVIEEVKITFDVIYEDNHILIVNKPAGVETQTTLTKQVLYYLYKNKSYDHTLSQGFTPACAHRLDKYTSGLVIFGKDMRTLQDLQVMLKERIGIEKYYETIVSGYMDDCYLEDMNSQGKTIITEVKNIDYKKNYSLLHIHLITGRKHQIREHLSMYHHPIVGDKQYHGVGLYSHQLLHAYKIVFNHPVGSLSYLDGLVITCEPDKEFLKIKKDIFIS